MLMEAVKLPPYILPYSPDHMPSNSGQKIQKTVLNGKLPTKWPDSEDAQKEEEGLVASEP